MVSISGLRYVNISVNQLPIVLGNSKSVFGIARLSNNRSKLTFPVASQFGISNQDLSASIHSLYIYNKALRRISKGPHGLQLSSPFPSQYRLQQRHANRQVEGKRAICLNNPPSPTVPIQLWHNDGFLYADSLQKCTLALDFLGCGADAVFSLFPTLRKVSR